MIEFKGMCQRIIKETVSMYDVFYRTLIQFPVLPFIQGDECNPHVTTSNRVGGA